MQATKASFERERQQLISELEMCREGLAQKIRRAEDAVRDELLRAHASETARTKAQADAAQEQWQQQVQLRLEKEYREKEEALRRTLGAERDKQVEAVVAKLEEDLHAERQASERRARDAESKASAHAARAQAVERELREKLVESERNRKAAETELAALREQLANGGSSSTRLQEQLRRLQEEAIATSAHTQPLLLSFLSFVPSTERRASREQEEIQRMHEEDLAQKDQQLEALEARVRKAIATRDETIAILRTEIDRQKRELQSVLQRR